MKTNLEKLLKNIPDHQKAWIVQNEWQEGARLFLTNAGEFMPKNELKNREMALVMAILWHELHDANNPDHRVVPTTIQNQLMHFFKRNTTESEEDYMSRLIGLWYSMNQHVAEYTYAAIEPQHPFHRALWGALRAFMNEDIIIEHVEIPIQNAIASGYKKAHPEKDNDPHYGVQVRGLDSRLVFIPKDSNSWSQHADMYVIPVRIPN